MKKYAITLIVVLLSADICFAKSLMVFAPHPDDEALIAAGVIARGVRAGDDVRVVLATNGDNDGVHVAHLHELETIAAMRDTLGVLNDNVIFLGYPDSGLKQLYYYYAQPTSLYTSPGGISQTYAYEGLGGTDYHTYEYGTPAPYNRYYLLEDIKSLLMTYRPDEIYVTSINDSHPDHHALASFVTEAAIACSREDFTYRPVLLEGIVHDPCEGCAGWHWPMTTFDPTETFPMPPFLATTPLEWETRESLEVPLDMQDPNPETNLKLIALQRYASRYDLWFSGFVRRDEVFWRREPFANLAFRALARASSGDTPAAKVNDGLVSGNTLSMPDAEWIAANRSAGQWVELQWRAPEVVDRIVLFDRPAPGENVLAGTLSLSDGSSIQVPALPVSGAPLVVTLPPTTVTWIRFTVTAAEGSRTGLAELEVYGALTPPPANAPPAIQDGPRAQPNLLLDTQTATLSVTASDVDGNALTYTWFADRGLIDGSGASVTFYPPAVSVQTEVLVKVLVSDGWGGAASGTATLQVSPGGNLARTARVTASSEQVASGQTAVKAVDGVVSGYPLNPIREWSSAAQLAGAWIALEWESLQAVSRIVLHDRVNGADQLTAGVLEFNDGSSLPVGRLPNDGSAYVLEFPTKAVTRVMLRVTGAVGSNVGLAEFEVYRDGSPNTPPVIASGPTAAPAAITDIETSSVTVVAEDAEGDALSFIWTGSAGTIEGSGATVTFYPPQVTEPTLCRVEVTISGARGGLAVGALEITVTPTPPGGNIARIAQTTASSQRTGTGQTAAKAVDGVVSGYPLAPTREWVSYAQQAGAWITLSWTSPQTMARVVLHDRINTADQITAGVLEFSDGTSLGVGALPNDGTGSTVVFSPKLVTWVTLLVTGARGSNVGLAEFEAFREDRPNTPPVIVSGPTASPAVLSDTETSTVSVVATDAEGDALSYFWTATAGTLQGSGAAVTYNPPSVAQTTFCRIEVTVSGARGGTVVAGVDITVKPTDNGGNLGRLAVATASSQNAGAGQTAAKTVDGVVGGYPTAPTREWVTVGQLAGAWIRLAWSSPHTVGRLVLHDRINTADQITAGIVGFSDGTTFPVGTLPNDGSGYPLDFLPRSVTWVTLTVTAARGANVGLAEFEVYAQGDPNTPPVISFGPTASPATISDTQSSTISVVAVDADSDVLTYTWSATGGTIEGSGPAVTYRPVNVTEGTVYGVEVAISDGRGGATSASASVTVTPTVLGGNLARSATATASSQNVSTGQTSVKAIDGVISGYPVDSKREWVSVRQLAGAWITLTWVRPQVVTRVVLHDRINATDQIMAGVLDFSDGSSLVVGTLPNDGSSYVLEFPAKTVSWVTFRVTGARGSNVGLAEFEVL